MDKTNGTLEEFLKEFEAEISENFAQARDMYFKSGISALEIVKRSGNTDSISILNEGLSELKKETGSQNYNAANINRKKVSYHEDLYDVLVNFNIMLCGDKKIPRIKMRNLMIDLTSDEKSASDFMDGVFSGLDKLEKRGLFSPFNLDDNLKRQVISYYYHFINL